MKKLLIVCFVMLMLVGFTNSTYDTITVKTSESVDLNYIVKNAKEKSGICVYRLNKGVWESDYENGLESVFVHQDTNKKLEFTIFDAKMETSAEYKGGCGFNVFGKYDGNDFVIISMFTIPEDETFRIYRNFPSEIKVNDEGVAVLGYMAAVPSSLYDENAKTEVDLTKDYFSNPELFDYEGVNLIAVVYKN